MKKMVMLLGIVVAMTACSDSNDGKPSRDNLISARKNGILWTGATEAHLNSETDTLTLLGISSGPNEEVIVLKVKLSGPGEYTLSGGQSYYRTTVGGDVIVSQYGISPGESGILTISDYTRGEIAGSFEVILNQNYSYISGYESQLKFTEGTFTATVGK